MTTRGFSGKILSWSEFIFKILTVAIIPAFIYITHNIEELNKKIDLINQRLDIRGVQRDQQIDLILKLIQDHEDRLRLIERQHSGNT